MTAATSPVISLAHITQVIRVAPESMLVLNPAASLALSPAAILISMSIAVLFAIPPAILTLILTPTAATAAAILTGRPPLSARSRT
jgi:hypothetical protein